MTENVIRRLKGIGQGNFLLTDHFQAFVGDDHQTVHVFPQHGDAVLRLFHALAALEQKRLGDDSHRQDPQITGDLRHNRCGAGTGAAAHSGSNKHHIRTLESGRDLLPALLGSPLSLFRIGTGSHPPGQLVADLDFLSGLGQVQRLMIRIH